MRDGKKRIPRDIPGSGCNAACRSDRAEGASDVTSQAHPTSRKGERTREGQRNC